MDSGLHKTLQHAVDQGIDAYVTSRRARIPGFIDRHFAFRGALALHRKTFGRDFYKYPINLMWGLPVALGHGTAALLAKAGAHRCTAGAHRGRTADCRAVRRVSVATAQRRGPARLPGRPRTASGGVWHH